MDNTITITPSGIAIGSPLVAGTQLSVTATGMEIADGAALFLIVTSRFPDLLVASCPLSETTTEGEYAGTLYTATKEMALFLANARADEARPASIELVDTAHGASIARTTVPIYNSSLIPQPCKWPSASPLYVPGPAATVLVGTTTTLPPGSSASVENAGTSSDSVLNFGIPQGAKGDAATISVGTTQTLQPGSDATVTNSGTSDAAVFNFGIPRGDKGDAATVAVGTTTTLAPGSSATVTNSGTASSAILNFGIPKGDKGDKGDTGDPQPSDADPLMSGAASPGVSPDFSRADHTHPTSRNILRVATSSSGVTLAPETAIYRAAIASDGTFPALDAAGIQTGAQYYRFGLELAVPNPIPAALSASSAWQWMPGKSLPDPSTLRPPTTLHIDCRMDCSSASRPIVAACDWVDGPVDVEYLESTSGQYIDTGVPNGEPFTVFLDFSIDASAETNASLFGSFASSSRRMIYVTALANGKKRLQLSHGGNGNSFSVGDLVAGTRHTVRVRQSGSFEYQVDGGNIGTRNFGADLAAQSGVTLWLFNRSGTPSPCNMRLYSAQIRDANDVLIRDYQPVRVGVTGELYDSVNQTLATRVGTFAIGPDKTA